jgi:hypothetical protein
MNSRRYTDLKTHPCRDAEPVDVAGGGEGREGDGSLVLHPVVQHKGGAVVRLHIDHLDVAQVPRARSGAAEGIARATQHDGAAVQGTQVGVIKDELVGGRALKGPCIVLQGKEGMSRGFV